jgi:hypothetical protein
MMEYFRVEMSTFGHLVLISFQSYHRNHTRGLPGVGYLKGREGVLVGAGEEWMGSGDEAASEATSPNTYH